MNVFSTPAGPQNYAIAGRTWVGGACIHATEGYLAGDLETLRFGPSGASAHDLIAPNGDVYAIVQKQHVAFHVLAFGSVPSVNRWENRPTWLPPYNGRYSAVNAATIGYELSGFSRYGFADAQYRSLARRLAEDSHTWGFPLTFPEDVGNAATVLTHARLQNDRSDPGPLFDWPRFKTYLAEEVAQLQPPPPPEEPMPTPEEQSILDAAARQTDAGNTIRHGEDLDWWIGTWHQLAGDKESLAQLLTKAQEERNAYMHRVGELEQALASATQPIGTRVTRVHTRVELDGGAAQEFEAVAT